MEQRLIDLEIKISHQESVIDTLQQLVYEQQKALTKLEGRLEQLTKRLDADLEIGPASEKPPHY